MEDQAALSVVKSPDPSKVAEGKKLSQKKPANPYQSSLAPKQNPPLGTPKPSNAPPKFDPPHSSPRIPPFSPVYSKLTYSPYSPDHVNHPRRPSDNPIITPPRAYNPNFTYPPNHTTTSLSSLSNSTAGNTPLHNPAKRHLNFDNLTLKNKKVVRIVKK